MVRNLTFYGLLVRCYKDHSTAAVSRMRVSSELKCLASYTNYWGGRSSFVLQGPSRWIWD